MLIVLGEPAAFRFKITPDTYQLMIDEIKRFSEGGDRNIVDPEAKRVYEQLTGFNYDHLYR